MADILTNDAIITDISNNTITVLLKDNKHKTLIPKLRNVVNQLCGSDWEVITTEEIIKDTKTLAEIQKIQQKSQIDELRTDPILAKALDIFKNAIINDVIKKSG